MVVCECNTWFIIYDFNILCIPTLFILITITFALQVEDLLRFETPRADETLLYILTLGVVDSYRNHGIGYLVSSLVHFFCCMVSTFL